MKRKPVSFRLMTTVVFDDLAADDRRRICRCVKEVWIDTVGPHPKYAKSFYGHLLRTGDLLWPAPSETSVRAFADNLARALAPGLVSVKLHRPVTTQKPGQVRRHG